MVACIHLLNRLALLRSMEPPIDAKCDVHSRYCMRFRIAFDQPGPLKGQHKSTQCIRFGMTAPNAIWYLRNASPTPFLWRTLNPDLLVLRMREYGRHTSRPRVIHSDLPRCVNCLSYHIPVCRMICWYKANPQHRRRYNLHECLSNICTSVFRRTSTIGRAKGSKSVIQVSRAFRLSPARSRG